MEHSPAEKLNSFQIVKKFPTFYRTQMFITTFIILHDKTANINENLTVYHKSATELFCVLNKKFQKPWFNWWLLVQSKAVTLRKHTVLSSFWRTTLTSIPFATDVGQNGGNFTWTVRRDDLWPGCLLSEGHDSYHFWRGNSSPWGMGQNGNKHVAGQLQKCYENLKIK